MGIAKQVQSTLTKIDQLLQQCGSSKQALLTADVFLRNLKDLDAARIEWNAWVEATHAPAVTFVQAQLANVAALVQIKVTAAQ